MLALACSDEVIRPGQVAWDAEGVVLPDRVFPVGPGDDIMLGGAGAGSGGTAGTGGSNEIPADPPPALTESEYCGDTVRDPVIEECDDGPGTVLDSCTQDCQVNDLLVERWTGSGEVGEFAPDRWLGSGRHPLAAGDEGFAVAYVEPPAVQDFYEPPPIVEVARFDDRGRPLDRVAISDGSFAVDFADPVVAALPGGAFAVAYTEFGGDGDELGIALHRLDADESSPGAVSFANETRHATQQAPDLVWTGSELVVAWEDTDSAATGPDVKYRRFDENLEPLGDEVTLAEGPGPEGKVALAATTEGFAAAWRQGNDDGLEEVRVFTEGETFSIEPHLPGPASDQPALAEIEPGLLLVVYTVGTDPDTSSVANVGRLYGALIDSADDPSEPIAGQPIYDFDINPYLSQIEPALLNAYGRLYVAWHSVNYDPVLLPGPEGEELWLKRLYWDGDLGALDTAQPEARLARWPEHEYGDQRAPALAASPLSPEGALAMAWTDHGASFGSLEGHPDVVVQFAPTPLLRGDRKGFECTVESPCDGGQGPCDDDSQCVSGTQCGLDRGPNFNYGVGTGVCAPDHCFDGVLSGNETDVDCGGDCGYCFDCPDLSDSEFAHFCTAVCRCDNLEGDCDSDYECVPGLVCDEDRGKHYGFAHDDLDACTVPHCANFVQDADETHIDCGGNDCAPCLVGDDDFCQDVDGQRCGEGEGDCDSDAECLPGLVCQGEGPDYGLPEGVDVCVPAACLPENLPPPNTQGHCTTECKCTAGVGICNSDSECQAGLECRDDRAVYYDPQLPFDLPLCVPLHCINGVQDMGETQVDCGNDCGDQCPSCDDTLAFASFEDPSRPWTAVEGTASTTQSNSTEGPTALLVNACGNNEVKSPTFMTYEWNIVGDQLLFDIYIPSNPDNPWWVGQVAAKVTIPAGQQWEQYFSGPQLQNLNWGAWNTVSIPLPQSVKDAFLGDNDGYLKIIVNIGCDANVQGSTQFLVDNVRFGGNLSFRPGCEPGGSTTGGVGGTTGTGGAGGTSVGGAGGAGGVGGTSSGAGGAGGNGGFGGLGGTSGSGGEGGGATGQAAQIFSFESPSYWAPTYQQENTLVTHLNAALRTTPTTWTELTSNQFSTTDVSRGQYLHLDVYVPTPSGSWGGSVRPIFICPSAGHFWTEMGADQAFLSHPFNQYYTLEWQVPTSVQDALDGSFTGCTIKLGLNAWNGSNPIILDNLRFTDTPLPPPPSSDCTNYTQIATPPFVTGGTIPNGSTLLPYRICTAEQLQTVIDTPWLWEQNFVVGDHLDLTDIQGQIGTFSGTLDGQGYTLENYGRGASAAAGGLIARLTGSVGNFVAENFRVHASALEFAGALVDDNAGSLTNITLTAGVSSAYDFQPILGGMVGLNQGSMMGCHAQVTMLTADACRVGGLVGHLRQTGSILDSSASGSLEQLDPSDCSEPRGLGGLVGYAQGHIGNSSANVSITAPVSSVGGLVGHLETPGDIQDSLSSGELVTGASEVGGLVGSSTGSIYNCGASSDVEAGDAAGGLVGWANGGSIAHSYASGSVTGQARTGGLVGKATACGIAQSSATGDVVKTAGLYVGGLVGALEAGSTLTDAYAWGDVVGSGQDSAALVGYSVAGTSLLRAYATGAAERAGLVAVDDGNTTYADCYWHDEKHTRAVGSAASEPMGTYGRSEAELLTQAGYSGYDFANVWTIMEGAGYAELR